MLKWPRKITVVTRDYALCHADVLVSPSGQGLPEKDFSSSLFGSSATLALVEGSCPDPSVTIVARHPLVEIIPQSTFEANYDSFHRPVKKLSWPIANAGFLIDQSYEEGKSFFGKTHSLEGVGGWEKTGNLLKEGGDIAATIGSGLALAGPVTFGVSDIAALGVELGGGAMALAGDLMDDYGKYEQDKKAQSTTTTQLATDKAKQASDAQASNVAVQSASAAGNRNLSGRGSIAQVSQSAVRNY